MESNYELSMLVARVITVIYFVVGLSMLINRNHYKKVFHNFVKNPAFIYFGGVTSLTIGFLLISYHNFWVQNWFVIITLIGWIALFKGLIILLFPNFMINTIEKMSKDSMFIRMIGIFTIILSLIIGYFCIFSINN